jgi:peptidylprolyl isomerase
VNKGLVLALCAGVVIALSGCAADTAESVDAADATALAEGCTPSGPAADALDIAGEFGQSPVVTFDAPLDVESTQRSVVIEGSGVEVAAGDDVLIDYALYNATSGAKIEDSGYTETSPTVLRIDPNAPVFSGVSLTVACSTVGSRVAGVIPASQAFGPDGAPEFGMEPGDGLLLIVDVVGIKPPPVPPLDRLEGEPSEPSDGFPSISYDDAGAPVVVIPEGDVPTEFALEALITGDGAVVGAADVVVVDYHGVNWNTGEVFDSSWERGQPGTFPTGGVIPGFRDALVGQSVGSRVVVIIPAALGYGPNGGTEDGSIGPEDTIVFVIDILGIQ